MAKTETGLTVRADYGERVSSQYQIVTHKMGDFLREAIKFGALLKEVEDFIGNEPRREGSGLKGWLEANCPEINYKTAQGCKTLAAKCAKMIGGGTQALACLQGRDEVIDPATQEVIDVDASFIERREELFATANTKQKLEQMWFDSYAEFSKKVGRPKGAAKFEFKKDPPEVEAARIWAEIKNSLECATLRDSIEVLEPRIAVIMVGVLKDLEKRLAKRANG